tara:strand:- start:26 stop:1156 length:1131 start_codon:yes stop_codon:yes gene_type:complete
MRTLLFILIQVALFTLLAFWYQQNPGDLRIDWLGYRLEMSIAIFLLLTSLLVALFYTLVRFILNIFHLPAFFRARYAKYNQMRGVHAIEDSLVAYLAQDSKLLKKTGKYVGSFLKISPLNFFFRGEAALLNQDYPKASALFKTLTQHDSMAFAGYYGLMRLALTQQDLPKAIVYGDLALAQNPEALPIRKKIANLSLETQNYGRALREITLLLKKNPHSVSLMKKKSIALYHLAQEERSKNNHRQALEFTEQALKITPDQQDLVSLHIKLLRDVGKERAAAKALEKAWQTGPQDSYLQVYLDIKGTKTDLEKFKSIQNLVSFAPDHPESYLATATYATKAQLWGPAHDALNKLMDKGIKSKAVYVLLDALEKAERK